MKINKVMEMETPKENNKPSDEELMDEYKYSLAEQMTRSLLKVGFIADEEYDRIIRLNAESFHPFITRISAI